MARTETTRKDDAGERIPGGAAEEALTFIADLARDLMDAVSLGDIAERTALAVYRISGAAYVLVSTYDRETRKLTYTAAAGPRPIFDDMARIVGTDARTVRIAAAELGAVAIAAAESGTLAPIDSIYDLFVGKLPRAACAALEREIGLTSLHAVGISWDHHVFGTIALLYSSGGPERGIIEAMARIVSVAMRRVLGEEERVYEQRVIADMSRILVSAETLDDIYAAIGPVLRRESGADYLFISGYDAASGRTTMRHSEGFGDIIQSLITMVGKHPRDIAPKRADIGEAIASVYDMGRFTCIPGGLYELSGKTIPKGVCATAARILGVRDIYGMGFSWNAKAHGVVTCFYREGNLPRNVGFVETLVQLVTMAVRRRIAEEERVSDEESFRRLVEHAPNAVFIRVGNVFAYVNDAAVKLFGAASRQDLIGADYLERVHPDFREITRERMRDLEERHVPLHSLEVHYLTFGGWRIAAEISAVPFAYGGVDGVLIFAANVTEKSIARERMRESEEKFRGIVEQSTDGIVVTDKEMKIIEWNKAQERLTGHPREKMLGTYLWDFQYSLLPKERQTPELYEKLKSSVAAMNDRSVVASIAIPREYDVIDAYGVKRSVQVTAFPIVSGGEVRYGSFTRDISERKRHERELVEQRELIQSLAYFQRDLMLLDAPDIMRASAGFLARFGGISAAVLIDTERGTAHIAIDDGEYERREYPLAELGGSSFDTVFRTREPLTVRDTAMVPAGNAVEAALYRDHMLSAAMYMPIVYEHTCLGVLGVFSKQPSGIVEDAQNILPILASTAALALRRAFLYDDVKRSEAWYRTLIERSHEAVIIYQQKERAVIDCNENAIRLFGYGSKETFSTNDGALKGFSEFLDSQFETMRDGTLGEFVIEQSDRSIPVEVRIASLPPKESGIVRISIIDVSDRARLEAERKRHTQTLMQSDKMKALGELAAGMAHEITQPLTGISLATQLLHIKASEGVLDAESVKAKLSDVADYVQRIKSLIEHVRMFSRDRAGDAPADFSVGRALGNALSLVGTQYRSYQIELAVDVSCEAVICGNIYEFEHVILHVLANARYAVDERAKTAPADYRKRIQITCAYRGGAAALEIRDNGIGIKASERDKIFDPFFTTKPVDKGSGLGLAVSFGIIKNMGGTISVESVENEYTMIHIEVPARSAHAAKPNGGAE